MVSKIKRRSGNAFTEYCSLIGWQPKFVIMVGVGVNCEEIDVMRETWKDFELYGFEASKGVFDALNKNQFPGHLKHCAIWNENCTKQLHVKPGWKDGSSLFESRQDQEQRKQERVVCRTLDSLFDNPASFNTGALWLDCEGSELQALQGAEGLIECIDVVNVELTSVGRGEGWSNPLDVHVWLVEHGFRHAYIHTIRPCIGQRDAIYLREGIYDPQYAHCF